MTVKAHELRSQDLSHTSSVKPSNRKRKHRMLWLVFFLAILLVPSTSYSVTIVKRVGHGDCYVVISDGRVIVIDAGRTSSVNGLVSMLRTRYTHFDRIVITHIHSDHAGGLITAERYARTHPEAAFSTDLLVSNHGEHDLNLVLRHDKVGPLMAQLRSRPIVALNDEALSKLALKTPHLEVRGIALPGRSGSANENESSLILKVTEIRDGTRRATLFLGDIEQHQQRELFRHPEAKEIFRDVAAVTLPHHGRPRTLMAGFFNELKKHASNELIALHSDVNFLDSRLAREAAMADIKVVSTASSRNKGTDVLVNLFAEQSYHQVGRYSTTLSTIVSRTHADLIDTKGLTTEEVVEAVAKYSNRSASDPLEPGTVISIPSKKWIDEEVSSRRAATEQHISNLASKNREEALRADSALSKLVYRLSEKQLERINTISPGSVQRWEAQNASAAEKEIRSGLARGWVVGTNNIDEDKSFIQTKWRDEDTPGASRYIVRDGPNNTWRIFAVGPKNSRGMTSDGRPLGTMRSVSNAETGYYELCEYCGRKAVGWCHMREKTVCNTHQYFTQGGVNWRCP